MLNSKYMQYISLLLWIFCVSWFFHLSSFSGFFNCSLEFPNYSVLLKFPCFRICLKISYSPYFRFSVFSCFSAIFPNFPYFPVLQSWNNNLSELDSDFSDKEDEEDDDFEHGADASKRDLKRNRNRGQDRDRALPPLLAKVNGNLEVCKILVFPPCIPVGGLTPVFLFSL